MGKTLSNTFGSKDPNATNDVLSGQVVATGTPGAVTIKDPNQGLTSSQVASRKGLSIGGKYAGSLMNQGSGSPQRGTPVQFTFASNQPSLADYTPPVRSPFFGS